ncbi:uncharacterized protein BO97DRAFT_403173 [Aspergillus homomorphus CBS 101889]|uniref:Uncharacterized protein n=1 Tax=Aspergillus homomorphus (strain CBS 101889) TaxID=1450537 RepID=A0A395IA97_ASPHC|nr:hypothetical protein BO97DRAFT_403173 [Aspergillus homomorphus CBS 101889]RAL15988.1 hypothetical protein BO97DRAFT_403173 [Aspergillus homomorphus CBS 101889]
MKTNIMQPNGTTPGKLQSASSRCGAIRYQSIMSYFFITFVSYLPSLFPGPPAS